MQQIPEINKTINWTTAEEVMGSEFRLLLIMLYFVLAVCSVADESVSLKNTFD